MLVAGPCGARPIGGGQSFGSLAVSAAYEQENRNDLAYLAECGPNVGRVSLCVGLALEAVATTGSHDCSTFG